MKVLAVDDSVVVRKIVKNASAAAGFEVVEAADGLEAMKIISDGYQDIALIVLDWNMPKMNGLEVLKQVKSSPEWKHLPVMMVTTEGQSESIITAVKAGVNNYLTKPFAIEELTKKIFDTAVIPEPELPKEEEPSEVEREGIRSEEFIQSFNETISQMSSLNLRRIEGNNSNEHKLGESNEVSTELRISGAVAMIGTRNYMIVVTAGMESARLINQYMTGSIQPTDSEIFDGIAELANMTAGFTKTRAKDEFNLSVLQPIVITGSGLEVIPNRRYGYYGAEFEGDDCSIMLRIIELD